jgi:membrane fusion protein, multidrug efflux system
LNFFESVAPVNDLIASVFYKCIRALLTLAASVLVLAYSNAHAQSPAAQTPRPQEQRQPGAGPGPAGGQAGPPGANAPVAVEVARVKAADVADEVSAVGTLRANETIVVRPEIAGRIAKLHFQEGQLVKRGQVLVSLDATVLAAEIGQAKAELALSRSNFKRTQELAAQQFVSASAKDEAAANLAIQEAKIALAEARLARSTIRAPFSGRVGLRQIAVGDVVREGADMFTLEDTATIKVDFRLPERYLSAVKTGQRVTMGTDALPGKDFIAAVELIDPLINTDTRSFLVRGKLANPQGSLRAGMFARVRLAVAERTGVLLVPEEAVTLTPSPGGNASYVFKVADGKAIRTQVKTGARRNAQIEIQSGLSAGDVVVTAGQIKIRGNEAQVRVMQTGAAPGTAPTGPAPAAPAPAGNSAPAARS